MNDRRALAATMCVLAALIGFAAISGAQSLFLTRGNATVALEGYGPNIIRVTMSLDAKFAHAGPGVGIFGEPSGSGWVHSATASGDEFRSSAMVVHVTPDHKDGDGSSDIAKYFVGSAPLSISHGKAAVPDGPGLGVALDPAAIQHYRCSHWETER